MRTMTVVMRTNERVLLGEGRYEREECFTIDQRLGLAPPMPTRRFELMLHDNIQDDKGKIGNLNVIVMISLLWMSGGCRIC